MSYTPTTWKSGDIVTSEKLNKIEQGIANATTAPLFVEGTDVGDSREELNKTWQEIYDALITQGRQVIYKHIYDENLAHYYPCIGLEEDYGQYKVIFGTDLRYSTNDINDYPGYSWD